MKLPTKSVYHTLFEPERERLYAQFCSHYKLDPDCESTVEQYFDAIDSNRDAEDEQ